MSTDTDTTRFLDTLAHLCIHKEQKPVTAVSTTLPAGNMPSYPPRCRERRSPQKGPTLSSRFVDPIAKLTDCLSTSTSNAYRKIQSKILMNACRHSNRKIGPKLQQRIKKSEDFYTWFQTRSGARANFHKTQGNFRTPPPSSKSNYTCTEAGHESTLLCCI
ncbi:hypothetical protein BD410DRAFT_786136, partial [Rickenella mellea]